MIRILLSVMGLTGIYALVLASFHPWDLAIGAALSALLLLALRQFLFGGRLQPLQGLAGRALAFFPFAVAVVWEILVGTWTVALVVLHLRPLSHPGIVAIPIDERTSTGVAVTGLVDTLSPGSVLVDVDWDRSVMLIHVIDASDPEMLREKHRDFYQRYQRRVFP